MRRTLAGTVAAVAVLLIGAAQAQAQGDSVVGDIRQDSTADPYSTELRIDASSRPGGKDPAGTATWYLAAPSSPSWTVNVTCLAVQGNTAVVGYSGFFSFAGLYPRAGLLRVVDGGGPASGQDSFEWAEATGPEGGEAIPGPTDCSSYPGSFTPDPHGVVYNRSAGDVVITDTQTPRQQARWECIFIRAALGQPAFRDRYGTGPDRRYAMPNCVESRLSD